MCGGRQARVFYLSVAAAREGNTYESVSYTHLDVYKRQACLPIAIAGLLSAIHQGKTSVASIGIVAKKPEQFGKAMLFPAMVETYAILALLISILAVSGIQV